MKLGIRTDGLSKGQVEDLNKSVAAAIALNENQRKIEIRKAKANSVIQRRGQSYPGDVGNNFGLMGGDIHGHMGFQGPFADTFPGSYFFSGFFGNDGVGNSLNLGYNYSTYGQGSHAGLRHHTRLAHYKMAMCVSAYKGFGLAKNVIDMMANFAAEGLRIRHPNKTVERFLNRWAFHVNLQNRVKDAIRYYYKYGNVFIYRTLGEIDDSTYIKLKRSKADINLFVSKFKPLFDKAAKQLGIDLDPVDDPQQSERLEEADKESKKKIGKRRIPWQYSFLNPFQMELRGTKFFGGDRWVFILDNNTVDDIKREALRPTNTHFDFLDDTEMNLPAEFLKSARKLSKDAPVDEYNDPRVVEIDQKKLYTMHYMKDDHEDWADPLLWPVMADIFYKNKLRQMDMSVCNSVINAVTIYKLGKIEEGYVAPASVLNKFSELLRTPTQAMQMVWNDCIDIVDSFPPVDRILGIAKYESVDRDILKGVGIPDTLIGGQTKSNFSTGFLGVRTLLERLEEARNTIVRWLTKELELLVHTLGIKKMPTIRFGKMSLRDEQAEKQLIIQLLDRNIISVEAVLEVFGEDFEIELERLKYEDSVREETGMFQKHSPYVDPVNDMELDEQLTLESELKQKEQVAKDRVKKNATNKNGRPGGSKGIPQSKKRATKPQGMAWFIEYEKKKMAALAHIDSITKAISDVCGERDGVEELSLLSAMQLPLDFPVTIEDIRILLVTPVDSAIADFYGSVKNDVNRKILVAAAIASGELEKQCQ